MVDSRRAPKLSCLWRVYPEPWPARTFYLRRGTYCGVAAGQLQRLVIRRCPIQCSPLTENESLDFSHLCSNPRHAQQFE